MFVHKCLCNPIPIGLFLSYKDDFALRVEIGECDTYMSLVQLLTAGSLKKIIALTSMVKKYAGKMLNCHF